LPAVRVDAADTTSANKAAVCMGINLSQDGTGNCTGGAGSQGVTNLIRIAVNVLTMVVGVAAVIMIIIGGLKYVTSSGDSANINSAKNTILYALVGLVVVVVAQLLVRFTISKATPAVNCPGQSTINGTCQ